MSESYTVKQGDTFATIGKQFKLPWKKIYEADENSELKEKRPNPNILMPGDVVVIPEIEPKQKTCTPGNSYRFKVYDKRPLLKIKFMQGEEPLADSDYTFTINDETIEGKTDSDGLLSEKVPIDLKETTIKINEKEYKFKINHLDPLSEISGIQARLNNLKYSCGQVDGKDGPKTQAAVKKFQRKHKLEVDGVAGENTQKKLKEIYGC